MKALRWGLLLLSGFAMGWLLRGVDLVGETGGAAQMPAISERAAYIDQPAPAATPPELVELQAHLAAHDWEAAVELYALLEDPGRQPELAERMRHRLLEQPRKATDQQALEAGLELLQRYTWYYHRDTEALQLLADVAQRLGRPTMALDALLDALEVALSGPDPEPARARVAQLVDALVAGRLQIEDRRGAMDLYERVLARDPLNYRYRYLLARQQQAAGDLAAARRQLDQIPEGGHDRRAVTRLRGLIDEDAQLEQRFSDGVPLLRSGSHYLVQVELDGGQALMLLLDTGASRSVLKPAAIARTSQAALLSDRIRVGTANGVVEAPRYRLPGLTLGPFRIDGPEVVMLELASLEGADGLLGMDLLQRFDYRIDPDTERLRLARRAD